MRDMGKTTICFKVDKDMAERLKKLAESEDMYISEIIRKALIEYMARYETIETWSERLRKTAKRVTIRILR